MNGENEGAQHVVGNPGTRIPEDLGVPRLQSQHRERLDPGVHARHDRESLAGLRNEPPQGEPPGVLGVGLEDVVEGVAHEARL